MNLVSIALWAWMGLTAPISLPDQAISNKSGNLVKLSDFNDSAVLVHFWATWCLPCIQELPYIEFLNQRLKTKPIQMLLVSVDDSWPTINNFLSERKLKPSAIVLLDAEKKWSTSLGVDKFPETFLISSNGKILKHWIGAQNWSDPIHWAQIDAIITKN